MQSTSARAYDLSAYEEARKPAEINTHQRPHLTVRTTRRAKKSVSPLRLFCCAVLLVCLVAVAICNQVAMVEKGHQLSLAQQELETLKNEAAILQTKLESTASTKTIEENASQLGMGRVEPYQINYVQLTGEDKIEVAEGPGDSVVIQSALSVYHDLLEYMKLK